jgi:hypothetical protein
MYTCFTFLLFSLFYVLFELAMFQAHKSGLNFSVDFSVLPEKLTLVSEILKPICNIFFIICQECHDFVSEEHSFAMKSYINRLIYYRQRNTLKVWGILIHIKWKVLTIWQITTRSCIYLGIHRPVHSVTGKPHIWKIILAPKGQMTHLSVRKKQTCVQRPPLNGDYLISKGHFL